MESMELLDRMDQLKGKLMVGNEAARDALEDNDYNVAGAIMELEGEPVQPSKEISAKTRDHIMDPSVTLRRKGKDLLEVPAVVAVGAVLVGLIKPKLLVLSLTALLVSGSDLAVSYGDNKEVSIFEAFRKKSGKAVANVIDLKDKLDEHYHDIKGKSFNKDHPKDSLGYYSIKL